MDVYRPVNSHDAPLVVLFPPHLVTKDLWLSFPELATALAEQGAVVTVANWSQLGADPASTRELLKVIAQGRAVQSCAIAYAVTHAHEYGADLRRLVVVGEAYGGNVAAVTTLGPRPAPMTACAAPATTWKATGLLTWDSDWAAAMPSWDTYGADVARITAALTPWPSLATAPHIPVVLAYSTAMAQIERRCETTSSPEWLTMRDPSGTMREQLLEMDAFADGCVDSGDAAKALAAAMRQEGIPATGLRLDGATTTEEVLDPVDQKALVAAITHLATSG